MRAFRIADRRFPAFDGTGARLVGGRWNSPGRPLIYAAETFSGAVLEILVHGNLGRLSKTRAVVEIAIPDTASTETVDAKAVPGWNAEDQIASRACGDQWLDEQRTSVLLVPGTVTGGREHNVLLNPEHTQFREITASGPEDVVRDERLFQR